MKIQNVADDAFRRYGKVLEGYDFTELLKEMKHTPVPEDVIYVPSVEEMEALPVAKELQNKGSGGLPIEIGYCNGPNKKLNGLDYQRSGYRSCPSDRTSAGYRKRFYICHIQSRSIPCSGRNRNRSICNNSSLCTMPCKRSRFPVRCCFTKRNKHGADF